eukprot:SAG11_NODE_9719_length_886_cov_1.109276_1_plen_81_part_00
MILAALRKSGGRRFELHEAERHTEEDSVLLVHEPKYVDWLSRFYAAWVEAGGAKAALAHCSSLDPTPLSLLLAFFRTSPF